MRTISALVGKAYWSGSSVFTHNGLQLLVEDFDSIEMSAKYILLGPADYRKRVSIQFGSRPPRFMGVFSPEVAPRQVLVMEQEVKALLEKGAIEYVPHSNRETGLYRRYFIVIITMK